MYKDVSKDPATQQEAVDQLYSTRNEKDAQLPWFVVQDIRSTFQEIFGRESNNRITDVEFLKYKDMDNYKATFKYGDFRFQYIRSNGFWSYNRELRVLTTSGKWVKVRNAQDVINLLEAREL